MIRSGQSYRLQGYIKRTKQINNQKLKIYEIQTHEWIFFLVEHQTVPISFIKFSCADG